MIAAVVGKPLGTGGQRNPRARLRGRVRQSGSSARRYVMRMRLNGAPVGVYREDAVPPVGDSLSESHRGERQSVFDAGCPEALVGEVLALRILRRACLRGCNDVASVEGGQREAVAFYLVVALELWQRSSRVLHRMFLLWCRRVLLTSTRSKSFQGTACYSSATAASAARRAASNSSPGFQVGNSGSSEMARAQARPSSTSSTMPSKFQSSLYSSDTWW